MKLQNLSYSEDIGKLLLRLIFGGTLLLNYGLPTFSDMVNGNFEYADPLGIGMGISKVMVVLGQFFCASLVLLGWRLRWACFPLVFIFLVAFFLQHHGDPFEYKELSLLYLGAFISLVFLGPGKLSISGYRGKN
ncbi:DoxX family protein [Flagellimonas flava]|uniref:Putative oxidoreductase n=1 Tax=Flagellimonas flava TaxID=570519 RepID=A0A1M5M4P8_9FLAO|nr:DoxX family protein [Allomuricauda flava]SHG71889.1 putative oxidoreductase [Allomuricauda flava]